MRATLRAAVTRYARRTDGGAIRPWNDWDLQIIVTRDIQPMAIERKSGHSSASRRSVPRHRSSSLWLRKRPVVVYSSPPKGRPDELLRRGGSAESRRCSWGDLWPVGERSLFRLWNMAMLGACWSMRCVRRDVLPFLRVLPPERTREARRGRQGRGATPKECVIRSPLGNTLLI